MSNQQNDIIEEDKMESNKPVTMKGREWWITNHEKAWVVLVNAEGRLISEHYETGLNTQEQVVQRYREDGWIVVPDHPPYSFSKR